MAKTTKKAVTNKRKAMLGTNAAPKQTLRKVRASASGKKKAAKTSSGGQPMGMSVHTYEIAATPDRCEDWTVGDLVDIYVPTPPPSIVTLNPGDECDGTKALFVE